MYQGMRLKLDFFHFILIIKCSPLKNINSRGCMQKEGKNKSQNQFQ